MFNIQLTLVKYFFYIITLFSTISFAQTSNNAKLTDSLNTILNQAFYYIELSGEEEKSLESLLQAEHIVRDNPNLDTPFFKAITNLVRARTLYNLGSIDNSKKELNEGLKNAKKANSKFIESYLYALKGDNFIYEQDYNNAKKFHLKAIRVLGKNPIIDNRITAIDIDVHLIDIYYSLADLEYRPSFNWRYNKESLPKNELKTRLLSASKYAKITLDLINEKDKRKGGRFYMLIILGQSYAEMGEFKLSKKYLDSCKKIVKDNDNLNLFRLNNAYGNYYYKKGETDKSTLFFENAYQHSRKYTDFIIKKFENRLDSEKTFLTKGLEGDLLKTETDLKKSERFKNLSFLLLISFVVIGLIMFVILQMRFLKIKSKANIALIEKNKELSNIIVDKIKLEDKIQNIQEVIARDLHDNFGNRIAGINTVCNILKDLQDKKEENADNYKKFLDHLNNGVMHLNSDIKDLIWANNANSNLFSAVIVRLEDFVNVINKTESCCSIRFEKEIDKDYILPSFWNRQILLIFKEAINNAFKYTNCEKTVMQIEVKAGRIKITCKDEGLGFDIENVERHSGLFNMPQRAKSIGCDLTINSSIGKGTEVVFQAIVEEDESRKMNKWIV